MNIIKINKGSTLVLHFNSRHIGYEELSRIAKRLNETCDIPIMVFDQDVELTILQKEENENE